MFQNNLDRYNEELEQIAQAHRKDCSGYLFDKNDKIGRKHPML